MRGFYGLMLLVFAVTLLVSATLLFLVQPMVGKMILPLLGGTPAVWNTCMVFFQAMLLLGYLYAHLTSTWLGVRKQALLHVALLFLPVLALPIVVNASLAPQGEANPVFGVLLLLFVAAGLPFFVVAASAPLLQKWFASTGHPAAADPYFLYGASNLGSMLALIGYPLLLEPNQTLPQQSRLWMIGYFALAMLIVFCAVLLWLSPKLPAVRRPLSAADGEPQTLDDEQRKTDDVPGMGRKLRWIALAFVPSSLMLGVTTYMTTDVAAIPLLWVVPLGLYLLSFILVFSRLPAAVHDVLAWFMPFAVIGVALFMLLDTRVYIWQAMLMHLGVLFLVSMVCHGELARDRPPTQYLTGYFLLMSLGGVLGGIFNTLVAPLIFVTIQEYRLALIGACLLLPFLGSPRRSTLGFCWELALAWAIGVLGAWLVRLGYRDGYLNLPRIGAASLNRDTLAIALGLLLVIAGYALFSRSSYLDRLFDIVLPILLGFLVMGSIWGLHLAPPTLGFLNAVAWRSFLRLPDWFSLTGTRGVASYGLPVFFCLLFLRRPMQLGLGVGMLFLFGSLVTAMNANVLHRERSFYGSMHVDDYEGDGNYHRLVHGNIEHGWQRMFVPEHLTAEIFAPVAACRPQDAALWTLIRQQIWTRARQFPVMYFHPNTPYGQLFLSFHGDHAKKNIAILGLGTGGLSGYATRGQKWTFFEINPAVEKIARNPAYFTFLSDCEKRGIDLKVVLGDGRLQLKKIEFARPEDRFDVIVFDAFTSDAIPIHLITYDALKDYLSKLTEDGIIVFHISNRYVSLEPVIARLQEKANIAGRIQEQDLAEITDSEQYPTQVVILAHDEKAFGELLHDPRWRNLETRPSVGLWTDDYSNLLRVFNWDIE